MAVFYSLIPAAGNGSRMRAERPKQYLEIGGKPLLRHVLDTFFTTQSIAHTFVVVSDDDALIDPLLAQAPQAVSRTTVVRDGGATRRDTVRNGLRAMAGQVDDDDWVLVHDAARPGLTVALVERLIDVLRRDPVGGLLALPVVDTLKRASADDRSLGTVARDGMWAAQTPQMFRYGLLCRALDQDAAFTDEASAVEALGLQPKLVTGSPRNLKITHPDDLALAASYLASPSREHP